MIAEALKKFVVRPLNVYRAKILNGAYVFRRLGFIDKLPICSYRTARSFSYVGLHFGVKPREAQPDDIWDFCIKNTDKYECVRGLSVLDGPQ
jgi:hypothetical protein